MLNPFNLKTKEESERLISDWWSELEYISKLRVLLRFYPKYNISKLEERGVFKLWKSIPLEEKKNLYNSNWQY